MRADRERDAMAEPDRGEPPDDGPPTSRPPETGEPSEGAPPPGGEGVGEGEPGPRLTEPERRRYEAFVAEALGRRCRDGRC